MNLKMCKDLRRIARNAALQLELPEVAYQKSKITGAIWVDPKSERGIYRIYKKVLA